MQKMHDRKNVGKVLLDPSLPSKSKADVRYLQNYPHLHVLYLTWLVSFVTMYQLDPVLYSVNSTPPNKWHILLIVHLQD